MNAPFAIDAVSGHIRFPDLPLEVRPQMPEAEFISATASLNRDNLGFNAGWQRYTIRKVISGDRALGLFVIFFRERLVKLSFAWAPKDETWNDWSEATEKARLQEYQQELDAQLTGKDALPWVRASVCSTARVEEPISGSTIRSRKPDGVGDILHIPVDLVVGVAVRPGKVIAADLQRRSQLLPGQALVNAHHFAVTSYVHRSGCAGQVSRKHHDTFQILAWHQRRPSMQVNPAGADVAGFCWVPSRNSGKLQTHENFQGKPRHFAPLYLSQKLIPLRSCRPEPESWHLRSSQPA